MPRYAKRNIKAALFLTASLASLGFGVERTLDAFPREMEAALNDQPSTEPVAKKYTLLVSGVGLFALATRQRVKHVAEASLADRQYADEQLEEIETVAYYHEEQLAALALQHYGDENEAEAEIITLDLEQTESNEELAVVIDLSSRHRDPPPTQPPINPDFTSVA